MGIEPTEPMLYMRPNGFEDRGRHQACKHFPLVLKGFPNSPFLSYTRLHPFGRLLINVTVG